MMSSAILVANFPTLVPPYFCTNHFAAGSMVFWCILGGVSGACPEDNDEEREDTGDGVDAADMVDDEEEASVWGIKFQAR